MAGVIGAAPAQAGLLSGVLGTVTKTVTTATAPVTTSTTSTSTTTATTSSPSTSTTSTTSVAPATTTTSTTATNPLGDLVASTTTTLSSTVTSVVGTVLPPAPTQAINVIPAGYDPITPLTQLLSGQLGPGGALQGILCPPTTELAQLLALGGGNPIGDGLTTLACNASILDYKFFTRFKRADGSMLEKTQSATLGVPTPLDVDGDNLPDLIGTITFTSLSTVGLVVDRVPTQTAQLPVSVEAVLSDPGGGLLGRRELAVGYDARMDRAPGDFTLSTPLDTLMHPSPDVHVTLAQKQRGERIALIAGAFDGTPSARTNPAQVRLDYGASPDNATLDAGLGSTVSLQSTTNRPGPAEITGNIVDNSAETRFHATLNDLPSSLGLVASTSGQLHATYTASARMAHLTGSFERVTHQGSAERIDQKALLDLTDVPTGMDVAQSGSGGSITTTGGPIGLAKVGVANGEPRFLSGEPAYVDVEDDGTLKSVSAQVPGVERATFDVGAAPKVSAVLQKTPFTAHIAQPGRTIDAHVHDLPHQVDLTLDLAGGVLDYNGHGDAIGSVDLRATSAQPFFARATKLKGTIEGIPARTTAHIGGGNGTMGVTVDGDGPLGKVELVASNGPEDLPAGDGQGAIYRDVSGGDYLVSARILDFRRLTFSSVDGLSAQLQTRGGPFSLAARTDTLEATGTIQDLPAVTTLGLDTQTDDLTFQGADADGTPRGIDQLALDARSIGGTLLGRADHVKALVKQIPASLQLGLATSGGQLGVTADHAIGSVELVAANRAPDFATDLPATAGQGIHYVDHAGGDYVVGARVLGLEKAVASIGDTVALSTKTAGGPFAADVTTDSLHATADVRDLPAQADITAALKAGRLTFSGHDAGGNPKGIDTLDVDATSTTPLFGRATNVHGHITGIPAQLAIDFAQSGDGVGVSADQPIGLVEIEAANRAVSDADLPAAGEQGVRYVDHAGGDYAIGARVRDLRTARVSTGTPLKLTTETAGGPFSLAVRTDTLTADGRIEDLPKKLAATLDLAQGKLAVDDSDAIGRILLDAGSATALFGRAKHVHADIRDIPASFTVDFAQNGDGIGVSADQPIGSIEAVASSDPIGDPADYLPANDEQGAQYIDHAGGAYLIAVRVRDLKVARLSTGTPLKLRTETAGGPFTADVYTDQLTAHARVADLPRTMSATLDAQQGKLTLDDSDRIASVLLDAHSTAPLFGRAHDVHADLEDIPAQLTIDFAQSADGVGVTANDAVGSIEVAASNHAFDPAADLPPGNEQGVRYVDLSGGDYALGARVRKLRTARITTGVPLKVDLETEGGPFSAHVATDALTADARIEDLPAQLHAALDLDAGTVAVAGKDADGNDATIQRILVDAHGATPLFQRATDVHADIRGIPANLTLDLARAGGGIDLTASDPIDSIEVVARDGAIADPESYLPANGEQGATFTDVTNGDFLLAARVLKLKHLAADVSNAVHVAAQTAGGPFTLHAQTDQLTGDAVIHDLPADLDASLDVGAGKLTLTGKDSDGNPQRIQSIALDLHSATPVFGRATDVVANIADIPGNLSLDLAQDAGGVRLSSLDANGNANPIGSLEIAAADHPVDLATDLPAGQGAIYHDTPSEFLLGARVNELSLVNVSLSPQIALTAKTAGGPFDVDVQTADITASGQLHDLPADVSLALDPSGGALTFAGKDADGNPQGIDSTRLTVTSAQPFFAGARRLAVEIDKLAPDVTLNLANNGTGGSIQTDQPIDRVQILASSDPAPQAFPSQIGDGEQGAVYHDQGSDFLLAARLLDLRTLSFSLAGESVTLDSRLRSTPFTVDLAADDVQATARIDALPAQAHLGFDLGNGHLTFDGKDADGNAQGIDAITFDASAPESAPLFGAARKLSGRVLKVPPTLDVGFDQTDGAADVTTTGGPIQELDFVASSDPNADYPADQGLVFHDTTDSGGHRDFEVGAKILGLEHIHAGLGGLTGQGAIGLDAKTAGGLFSLDIATDAFSASGTIDQLPSEAKLSVDLGDGGVSFDGSSGIDHLNLDAASTPDHPLIGLADRLKASIDGLPKTVDVGLQLSEGKASVTALDGSGPDAQPVRIPKIEIGAWQSSSSEELPANGQQGVIYRNVTTGSDPHYSVGARILDLQSLTADFGGGSSASSALSLNAQTAGGPFVATIESDTFTGDVSIVDLPTNFDLSADLSQGQISYDGHGQSIGLLSAEVHSATPLIGLATKFKAVLQGLPSSGSIALSTPDDTSTDPNAGTQLSLTANGTIQQIDLQAADEASDYPTVPGASTDDGAYLKSTADHFLLAARVYQLQSIAVNTSPISLEATTGVSKPFHADVTLPATGADGSPDPSAAPVHVKADILNLPSHIKLGLGDLNPAGGGGSKLDYQATSAINEITLTATGIALLEGADNIDADIKGVPAAFSLALPEANTGQPLATLAVGGGAKINELRLAAGGIPLSSLPTGTGNDKFTYNGTTSSFGVGVRLTGVKGLSMNLDPINLSLDQDETTTKPIDISATLPQTGGPNASVTGTLNKPSFHTEVGVTLPPPGSANAPTAIRLVNGTSALPRTMTSISLTAANLGSIPNATFSLANVPRVLDACLATDPSCIRDDSAHHVGALPNYSGQCGQPSQNSTQPGVPYNRPYMPQVSMYFDDEGTSGSSSAISSMVTMNANITIDPSQPHVVITDLRFHNVSLDFGQNGTTFKYKPVASIGVGDIPRMYMYIDSQSKPFVINDIQYPPQIQHLRFGTDSNTANGLRRFVWVPGPKGGTFGCSISQSLDIKSTGSLNCGNRKELSISSAIGNINAFAVPLFGDILGVCTSGG